MLLNSICYPLVDCLLAPVTCGAIAYCLRILVASSMLCSRLAVAPFRRRPTRTATATVITIGVVGRYPNRFCCHHQCRSSCCRLRCLCRRCPDVSVVADAPAAPPLPPSFVTDPMTGRLRLATVPRQWRRRRPRRQRKRRSTTNVMVPTPDADPPMLNSRDDGGHRGDSSGEYGDRDDVNDRDRCRRGSLGERIGRATR